MIQFTLSHLTDGLYCNLNFLLEGEWSMAGHAHRRQLLQLLATALLLGSLVCVGPSSRAGEADAPSFPPNKAAPPPKMPPAASFRQISVTSFEIVSLRPSPIVLDGTTLGEYLIEFTYDRSGGLRSGVADFTQGLSIVFDDDGRPVRVTAPYPKV